MSILAVSRLPMIPHDEEETFLLDPPTDEYTKIGPNLWTLFSGAMATPIPSMYGVYLHLGDSNMVRVK